MDDRRWDEVAEEMGHGPEPTVDPNSEVERRRNRVGLGAWGRTFSKQAPDEREKVEGCGCPYYARFGRCYLNTPYTLAPKPKRRKGPRKSPLELAAALEETRRQRDETGVYPCWVGGLEAKKRKR